MIWEGWSFDLYPDGSVVKRGWYGTHTHYIRIRKGNYVAEMIEELFMFGFVLRPVQVWYLRKRDG